MHANLLCYRKPPFYVCKLDHLMYLKLERLYSFKIEKVNEKKPCRCKVIFTMEAINSLLLCVACDNKFINLGVNLKRWTSRLPLMAVIGLMEMAALRTKM